MKTNVALKFTAANLNIRKCMFLGKTCWVNYRCFSLFNRKINSSMACVLMKKFQPFCKPIERILKIRQSTCKMRTRNSSSSSSQGTFENSTEVDVKLANGNAMSFSSGKLAKLADGCASVTYGNTTVVATAVSKNTLQGGDFFVPLTVFYHQRAAALGRIPLNFLRRELGQTEHEVLTSRIIDRSIRPLFPTGFNWDTQIICSPLAVDGSNFPDVLGINAASAALAVSDIPWNGPVGAVRVGLLDGKAIVNPTKRELQSSQLNLVVTTRCSKTVIMLEGVASNINQSDLFKCLKTGTKECGKIIKGISDLKECAGKQKRGFEKVEEDAEVHSAIESLIVEPIKTILQDHSHDKLSRDKAVFDLRQSVIEQIKTEFGTEKMSAAGKAFTQIFKELFRNLIFETEIRCDGRTLKQLRDIKCEVDLFEPLHGSALFQRGQTQVMCTVALDSPNSALKTDKISMLTSGIKEKNFFVHYEFPPFATNEAGRVGPIGRREIGHGILAEKALQANIPEKYPFTIRLTAEVLESNGSSSMATVCGGTLALMDAGVGLQNPCAGVAMGFISKTNDNGDITEYRILTDLLGIEDFLGEMDFKVAGTKKAYTAFQLDVKNHGIPLNIIFEILTEAKDAISEILAIMKKACPETRTQAKKSWPQKTTVNVPVHLRSRFIGPGGSTLKKLEMTTGVEVTEEIAGEFHLFAPNAEALKEANEMIAELLVDSDESSLEFGGVYSAIIMEIKSSGCMVTLFPNMKPVLVPLSQLDVKQVSHPSALGLQTGQEIRVKYFGRDPVSGRMRLSRKILLGPASEVARSLHRHQDVPDASDSNFQEEEEVGKNVVSDHKP